jgi:hypothetical protein
LIYSGSLMWNIMSSICLNSWISIHGEVSPLRGWNVCRASLLQTCRHYVAFSFT